MTMIDVVLRRLYRQYEGIASYMIRQHAHKKFAVVKIVDLHDVNNEDLGYTSRGRVDRETLRVTIYVNSKHKIAEELNDEEIFMLMKGVIVHEILHQLLSDFRILEKLTLIKPGFKAKILATLNNIIEDAFIERFAFMFFGEDAIRSIHFAQAVIYNNSPVVHEQENDLAQYINALIQYKVFGPIKGYFTNTITEEVFEKSLDPLDKAVSNRVPEERFKGAEELLEISKPLWEEEAKDAEAFEEFMKKLMEALKKMGMPSDEKNSAESGTGTPMSMPSDEDAAEADKRNGESQKSERQSSTRKKMSDKRNTSDDNQDDKSDNSDSDDTDKSDGKTSSASSKSGNDTPEITNTEEQLTEAEVKAIREEARRAEAEIKAEEALKKAMKAEKIDFAKEELSGKKCVPRAISNRRIIGSGNELSEEYQMILRPALPIVKKLADEFRRIFCDAEATDFEYKRSGKKIDLIRANAETTPYIFRRETDPSTVGDTAIMLVVDESGSMGCTYDRGVTRSDTARLAAIVLAEVCRAVKMPFGCVGFTADTTGSNTVQHNVYCNFRNKKSEMHNLCNISARYNNMDGVSIRYSAKLLAKQAATNKIMIVISDGQPACYGYRNFGEGIEDTQQAVSEVRAQGISVIGVAIDHPNDADYTRMYGKDYVPCVNVADLPKTLCKVLRKEIHKRR